MVLRKEKRVRTIILFETIFPLRSLKSKNMFFVRNELKFKKYKDSSKSALESNIRPSHVKWVFPQGHNKFES